MREESPITFRPVVSSDLAMIRNWMDAPHWQAWWGDPDEECGMIRDMIEGRDTTRPFIFQEDGRDVGYIQFWVIADQMFEPWITEAPWMRELPAKAIGVDLSIGRAADLDKGLGSIALGSFVRWLRGEGHTEIFIDPDPANLRAIRCYEKAGFVVWPQLAGRTSDVLIMRHEP